MKLLFQSFTSAFKDYSPGRILDSNRSISISETTAAFTFLDITRHRPHEFVYISNYAGLTNGMVEFLLPVQYIALSSVMVKRSRVFEGEINATELIDADFDRAFRSRCFHFIDFWLILSCMYRPLGIKKQSI